MSNPPIFDLSGRVALVTGASSGFGAHFARILAKAGAKVVVGARRKERLETLVAEIKAAGGQACAVALDVSDESSIIAAYDEAERVFGTVDTIIANAGINSITPVTDVALTEIDEILNVNLRGAFLTVREGGKRLMASGSREKEHGRVVIIASMAALGTEKGLALYSATKAGVLKMGEVIAKDWIRMGICVNMICPGYIKTEMNDGWFDSEAGAKQIASFNRRRLGVISDLDVPLLFLASDASRGITGTAIKVDDGQTL
jgi:NAD(P)-dependent dehydrogenase (short-subunit alcohol dehydrogenase family)